MFISSKYAYSRYRKVTFCDLSSDPADKCSWVRCSLGQIEKHRAVALAPGTLCWIAFFTIVFLPKAVSEIAYSLFVKKVCKTSQSTNNFMRNKKGGVRKAHTQQELIWSRDMKSSNKGLYGKVWDYQWHFCLDFLLVLFIFRSPRSLNLLPSFWEITVVSRI